jgi:uncharacterized membrane protein
MLAELGDTAYDITKILHILTVVVGFGGVILGGIYGAHIKKANRDVALGIFDANEAAARIAEIFIYLVPITGIGLLFQTKNAAGERDYWFDQTWVWLSLVIYIVALVVVLTVLRPALKQLRAAIDEQRGPDAGKWSQRVGMSSGVLHLSFAIVLILMVTKPGL